MKNLKYINIVLGLIFSVSATAGGGWPQPKGKTYLKLSQWWSVGNQHYTDLGLLDDNVTLGIYNTSLYAEHGFTDRLTGVVYFPFFSRTFNNNLVSRTTGETLAPGDAINSIGDTDIKFKYGITKPGSKIAVSGSILFGIPLGNDAGGTQKNLQTGDGEFNQLLQLDAGTGIQLGGTTGLYANAYAGLNNRTKGFSDEVRIGAEVGVGLNDYKWLFITRLDILQSLENGSLPNQITSTSIFANNTEYTSIGFEVNYTVDKKYGLSVGYATAVNGRIIVASPSYSVGVFVNL
jgi:hypothetical protein